MNKQMTEVYAYYKKQYPKMAILFRISDNFVAFFDDAEKIGDVLQISVNDPPEVHIPADRILEKTAQLHQSGITIKTISWRNDEGQYAIPDIEQLKEERENDY